MNITVLAVGNKMPGWVDEAVKEYAKRFGRDIKYTLKEIKPEKRGAGVNAAGGGVLAGQDGRSRRCGHGWGASDPAGGRAAGVQETVVEGASLRSASSARSPPES